MKKQLYFLNFTLTVFTQLPLVIDPTEGRCSIQLSYFVRFSSGNRTRTCDLMIMSHLSYHCSIPHYFKSNSIQNCYDTFYIYKSTIYFCSYQNLFHIIYEFNFIVRNTCMYKFIPCYLNRIYKVISSKLFPVVYKYNLKHS